jgi:hypothetical protein
VVDMSISNSNYVRDLDPTAVKITRPGYYWRIAIGRDFSMSFENLADLEKFRQAVNKCMDNLLVKIGEDDDGEY